MFEITIEKYVMSLTVSLIILESPSISNIVISLDLASQILSFVASTTIVESLQDD